MIYRMDFLNIRCPRTKCRGFCASWLPVSRLTRVCKPLLCKKDDEKEGGGEEMFSQKEATVIRELAVALQNVNKPSKQLVEQYVELAVADSQKRLEMAIEASHDKMATAAIQDGLLQLVSLFPGETRDDRIKRANALRFVNRLRESLSEFLSIPVWQSKDLTPKDRRPSDLFTDSEIAEIRRIAAPLDPQPSSRQRPSAQLIERLVEIAREGLELLCLHIDACAATGKLHANRRGTEGYQLALKLKTLMCHFPGDWMDGDGLDPVRRSNALRYINKLRGCRAP